MVANYDPTHGAITLLDAHDFVENRENPLSKEENHKTQPSKEKAVLFDLYGTLITLDTRSLLRKFARYLKAKISPEILRRSLVLSFEDETDALEGFLTLFADRKITNNELIYCQELLNTHLNNARTIEGAESLLLFLKRRGYKIALLSNVAQIFTKPFFDLGLDKYFDAVFFSCDLNDAKPSKNTYLTACNTLQIAPENCVFLGDNPTNDFDAPVSVGMRAIHIGQAPRTPKVKKLNDIWWTSLEKKIATIMSVNEQVNTEKGGLFINEIEPLNDEGLGRYNLVARMHGKNEDGSSQTWFAKRFLHPTSAQVEITAYELMGILGIKNCEAVLTETSEPLLLVSQAPGSLWQTGDFDEDTAEALGAQAAAAFIISNADWRPRNTFVCRNNDLRLTSIDLEYCLFDRVLNFSNLSVNSNDPKCIDGLSERISEFTCKRVLSTAKIKRAVQSFIANEDKNHPLVALFLNGWDKLFDKANENKEIIARHLYGKIQSGGMIIGTKAYRRAFSNLDIDDLLERIETGKTMILADELWSGNK